MKTYQPKGNKFDRKWHLIDAKDQVLGRISTDIAMKLMGKNKATYSPHADNGDYVVVINAKDVKVTGNKADQKKYRRHSGYPGGFKEMSFKQMQEKKPAKIIEIAVKRMLPPNRRLDDRMNRLKVFEGEKHNYGAQIEK